MQTSDFIFHPNPSLAKIQPSLIREIQNVQHGGSYPRIDLGLGELQFPMPMQAREANQKAIYDGKTRYSPNAGLPALRTVVAKEFSEKHKVVVATENVIITVGSTGALFIIFETFLSPGD